MRYPRSDAVAIEETSTEAFDEASSLRASRRATAGAVLLSVSAQGVRAAQVRLSAWFAIEGRGWRGLNGDRIVEHAQNRLANLYESITNRIVADLEQGVRPWIKPWSLPQSNGSVTRPLRHTGEPYSGINVLLLWAEAISKGFTQSTWMTFRQAQKLGASVRKGEKASIVVYADKITRTERDETGADVEKTFPFLRSYAVFNVEQIDGLDKPSEPDTPQIVGPNERIERCEHFARATAADIRHGGDSAYYAMNSDYIQMPPFDTFVDGLSYYATLNHELVHWTRHSSRLDRGFGQRQHGDEAYACEELVAELGAAFLCADLGCSLEPRADHSQYIASWLTVLKGDKRFIFSAAAHAQRAVDFLQYRNGFEDLGPT